MKKKLFCFILSISMISTSLGMNAVYAEEFTDGTEAEWVGIPENENGNETDALSAAETEEDVFASWQEENDFVSDEAEGIFSDETTDELYNVEAENDTTIVDQGTCGEHITWTVDEEGTLRIKGTGDMPAYNTSDNLSPWSQRDDIFDVIIESGITSIGAYAFYNCGGEGINISIPDTVVKIGKMTDPGDYENANCREEFANAYQLTIDEKNPVFAMENNILYSKDKTVLLYCVGNPSSVTISSDTKRIGKEAFQDKWIYSIVLPDGLESIGEAAFKNCYITKIEIPEKTETIAPSAFEDCCNLYQVTFSEGLKTIGELAFKGCSNIRNITIPKSVESIADNAFDTSQVVFTVYKNSYAEKWANSHEYNIQIITVPIEIKENDTVKITLGSDEKHTIEHFTFEPSRNGFYNIERKNISILNITGSNEKVITTSPDYMPYLWSGEKYSITVLGYEGGEIKISCYSDKNYTDYISAGMTLNGNIIWTFDGATISINGNGKMDYIWLDNNFNNLKFLKVSEGVTEIPSSICYGKKNLQKIILPASLETIGSAAFYEAVNLNEIILPEDSNLSFIGENAFEGTAFVKSQSGDYVMLGNRLLKYRGQEKKVTIPEKVTILGGGAIRENSVLEEIQFSSNLKIVGEKSLEKCTNLKKVDIPSSVTSIGYAAFSSDTALEDVVINEGVKEIGVSAFLGSSIKTITIPKSVTSIGTYAIGYSHYNWEKGCFEKYSSENLPTINCWANTAGYEYAKKEGIPYKLLDEKTPTPIPTVKPATPTPTPTVKPASPTPIPTVKPATPTPTPTQAPAVPLKKGKSFKVGTNKYKVTGQNAVSYTGTTNKKATKITIGNTVSYKGVTYKITSVAAKALRNHGKVTQVAIGNNVTSVGTSAFEGCKVLKKVTIGSKVTTLGSNTFKNCKKLSNITLKTTKLKTVKGNAFKGIYAKAKIHVPSSKLKAYKKLLKNKGQGSKVKISK